MTDTLDTPASTAPATACHRAHHKPSRAALAARSLYAVDRLPEGSPERAQAFAAHMEQFSSQRRACPLPAR